LGYRPQPANLMEKTGEIIARHFHLVRCFDFLNHAENMRPFARVMMSLKALLFEPALALSWAPGFTVEHYLSAAESLLSMTAEAAGLSLRDVTREIALGLKDMAGVCPPRFIAALVRALKKSWPELVLHYHRHTTDGLFIPSVAAAAEAGAEIIDVALGAAVRSYGQGDALALAAHLEGELGLKTALNRELVGAANFVLKQVMPYYDRYAAPYFQGLDYEVTSHGMPGGATSSSQEGALHQGRIHLLPFILRFLAGTRRLVRYHDVTPGSQITWNTAFLAVTQSFDRGGWPEVESLLRTLETVTETPEENLSEDLKVERLLLYADANDAFRDLLLGRFGPLPLGFPPDWVYQSAFGPDGFEDALAGRTEESPLSGLPPVDFEAETAALETAIGRPPTEEELVMYLNQPADSLKTIRFRETYGNPNSLPLDVWFEGLASGQTMNFTDTGGKPHRMTLLDIQAPEPDSPASVRFVLDSEIMRLEVPTGEPGSERAATGPTLAQRDNPYHVAAPLSGDLWVLYVKPGDLVHPGQELFNLSIMKQEKAVTAAIAGQVKRVLKEADFKTTRRMTPVRAGELIVELAPLPHFCPACGQALPLEDLPYCPFCGGAMGEE